MPLPTPTPDPLIPAGAPVPDFRRGGGTVPLITIGIPSFNRPQLLAEALASIAAQQDFTEYEVVISDDGALPGTRQVVEASEVRSIRYYANVPALGPVRNWNRCIELAAGAWVTILHEDDLLYPWFFRTVAPRLRDGLAGVSVRCVQGKSPPQIDEPAEPHKTGRYAPLWFLKASMTPFPGVVFPRALALRLGGFDPNEGGLADYAFWYALASTGTVEVIRTPAAFYRVNEGQWTEREWPVMLRRAHLLRLRIAREQLGGHPRLGRWIARFYTARMARAYARRFTARPAALVRAQRLERIAFSWMPSGWVWALLKVISRTGEDNLEGRN